MNKISVMSIIITLIMVSVVSAESVYNYLTVGQADNRYCLIDSCSGGSGGQNPFNWSLYDAVSDVDLDGYFITGAGDILADRLRLNGASNIAQLNVNGDSYLDGDVDVLGDLYIQNDMDISGLNISVQVEKENAFVINNPAWYNTFGMGLKVNMRNIGSNILTPDMSITGVGNNILEINKTNFGSFDRIMRVKDTGTDFYKKVAVYSNINATGDINSSNRICDSNGCIGSSGGSDGQNPFDQSLNTTDNVEFQNQTLNRLTVNNSQENIGIISYNSLNQFGTVRTGSTHSAEAIVDIKCSSFPCSALGFQKDGVGDWGLSLSDDSVSNVCIGVVGNCKRSNNFKYAAWRFDYLTPGDATNTFQNSYYTATTKVPLAVQGVNGQTANLFEGRLYGQTASVFNVTIGGGLDLSSNITFSNGGKVGNYNSTCMAIWSPNGTAHKFCN
jgi:hypothetical protein